MRRIVVPGAAPMPARRSASFFTAFQINPAGAVGEPFLSLGDGEWNLPRLRSLLSATLSGAADVDAYEMDLTSERLGGGRSLLLNAHLLSSHAHGLVDDHDVVVVEDDAHPLDGLRLSLHLRLRERHLKPRIGNEPIRLAHWPAIQRHAVSCAEFGCSRSRQPE